MPERQQEYLEGVPKIYTDPKPNTKNTKSRKRTAALLKRGAKAYAEGKRLPDSYFKDRAKA